MNLELDTADIAEVLINGISAGKILWRPYRFDITKLCKPGSNDIKLRLTSNNAAVMTLETVELLYQSVARYSQDVPVQNCGIRSTGTINKIKKKAYRTDKSRTPDGNLKMRADLSEPGGDVNAHILNPLEVQDVT